MQRRTLLSGVGAIGTVVLAGCSGGGNEGSDGNTEASGGACPSLPLSYTEKRVDISPKVAFDVPASATLTTIESGNGATVQILSEQVYTDQQDWTLDLITIPWEGASSVEAVEAEGAGGLEEEVTGEYDLAVENGRVFSHSTFPQTRIVYLPTESGPIRVRVQPSTMETENLCSDAVQGIRRRTIETVRPVE